MDPSSVPGRVIGGVLATLLISWLTTRAVRAARVRNGRYLVEYRLSVKILAWCCFAVGLLGACAASRASANQRVIAVCAGGAFFLGSLYLLLQTHFVRIEFDEEFVFTFSPWRKRRLIPWSAIIGCSHSALNQCHILKTRGYGSIWLSELLSGLGIMREKWERKGVATLQPTTVPRIR
jgi:hypothetical protein